MLYIFFVLYFVSFVLIDWKLLNIRLINVVFVGLSFFFKVLFDLFIVMLIFDVLEIFCVFLFEFCFKILGEVLFWGFDNWLMWLCCRNLFFLVVFNWCKVFIFVFVWGGGSFEINVGCIMGFVLVFKVVLVNFILFVCFILCLIFEFVYVRVWVLEVGFLLVVFIWLILFLDSICMGFVIGCFFLLLLLLIFIMSFLLWLVVLER